MPKRIVVVIAGDPTVTHRPVEALRIALGLSSGEHDTTIVLLGEATRLLTNDVDDVVDVEIFEKYRPSLQQLGVPFWVQKDSAKETILTGFTIFHRSTKEIRALLSSTE